MNGTMKLMSIAAAAIILCGAMLAAGELLEREQRRLDRAKETHATEVERAWEQFLNRVDRANRSLNRVYEPLIEQYDRRGETGVSTHLQREVEQLCALETIISRLANVDLGEGEDNNDEERREGHQALIQAIGPALVYGNGRAVPTQGLAGAEYVVLYFSAEWCGPCRRFTPDLIRFYQQHGGGKVFEVVLVSSDRSPQKMMEYLASSKMPWPAIPYDRLDASGIKQAFGRSGIPHLVVLNADGKAVMATPNPQREQLLQMFSELLRKSD